MQAFAETTLKKIEAKKKDKHQRKEHFIDNTKDIREESEEFEYECGECGAKVSKDDKICPKCGADISETDEEKSSPEEEVTIKGLVENLTNPLIKEPERKKASMRLVKIGKPAVKPLVRALRGLLETIETRIEIIEILCKISTADALEAVEKFGLKRLIIALKQKDLGLRKQAAKALDKIGWKPESTKEKVLYLIAKGGWQEAAEIGESAVEPLIQEFMGTDKKIRRLASETLVKIGKSSVEPLIKILRSWGSSDDSVMAAARALGKIGEEIAVEPLIRILRSWRVSDDSKKAAANSLKKIGTANALEAVRVYKADVRVHKAKKKRRKERVLGVEGVETAVTSSNTPKEVVIKKVVEALTHPIKKTREYAVEMLRKIQKKKSLPLELSALLTEILKDTDWVRSNEIVQALGILRSRIATGTICSLLHIAIREANTKKDGFVFGR